MTQKTLFPDERIPCKACQGTGRRMNHELGWRDERECPACHGSGREADRANPEHGRIPY